MYYWYILILFIYLLSILSFIHSIKVYWYKNDEEIKCSITTDGVCVLLTPYRIKFDHNNNFSFSPTFPAFLPLFLSSSFLSSFLLISPLLSIKVYWYKNDERMYYSFTMGGVVAFNTLPLDVNYSNNICTSFLSYSLLSLFFFFSSFLSLDICRSVYQGILV